MSNESDLKFLNEAITPGPCAEVPCPPPTEIVCIKADKVYQECKQTEVLELKVYEWDPRRKVCDFKTLLSPPPGASGIVNCEIMPQYLSFGACACEVDKADNKNEWHDPCLESPCQESRPHQSQQQDSCCEMGNGRISFNLKEDIVIDVLLEFDNGVSKQGCLRIKAPYSKTVIMSRAGTHPMFQGEVNLWVNKCLLCFIEKNHCDSHPEIHCCINLILVYKLFAEVQLLVPTYGFSFPPDCEEGCPPELKDWPPYPPQETD